MWREYPQISHQSEQISTHTSRVGCDSIILMLLSPEKGFLLTHPVWDVTIHGRWAEICNRISTHTSRVGCDKRFLHFFSCLNISTHTSRVGCDYNCIDRKCCLVIFLLTHPVWDVTHTVRSLHLQMKISTHTSRVGCDQYNLDLDNSWDNFYSHIPCGMWLTPKASK